MACRLEWETEKQNSSAKRLRYIKQRVRISDRIDAFSSSTTCPYDVAIDLISCGTSTQTMECRALMLGSLDGDAHRILPLLRVKDPFCSALVLRILADSFAACAAED